MKLLLVTGWVDDYNFASRIFVGLSRSADELSGFLVIVCSCRIEIVARRIVVWIQGVPGTGWGT